MDSEKGTRSPTEEQTGRSWAVLLFGNSVLGYILMIAGIPRILTAIPFFLVGWALYEMRPRTGAVDGIRTGFDPIVYWVHLVFLSIGPLTVLLVLSIA